MRKGFWLGLLACACASGTEGTSGTAATIADDGGSSTGITSASTTSTTADPDGTAGETSDLDTSGSESTGDSTPPDLSDGTWEFENVSDTPAMSLHAQRVVLEDGREFVGWGETDLAQISIVNIFAAAGPDAWASSVLTSFDVQNTFPAMAGGTTALLTWTGRQGSDDDNDIYFAVSENDGFGPARNLSDGFEGATPTSETRSSILLRSDGVVVAAYLSQEPGMVPPPPEVYVSEFMVDNTPSDRTAVVNPTTTFCNDTVGAAAPSNVGHFLLSCTIDGSSSLVHATDRSGEWDSEELAGVGGGVLTTDLVSGPDGVHAVWVQDVACGGDTCDEVFYASTTDDVFGTPIQVTDTANLDERHPTVGVDPWGRVVVMAQARVDNVVSLRMSVAENGRDFAEAVRISPEGTLDDYQAPANLVFDDSGYPSFVLEVGFDGSDPLNFDIYVARFIPN